MELLRERAPIVFRRLAEALRRRRVHERAEVLRLPAHGPEGARPIEAGTVLSLSHCDKGLVDTFTDGRCNTIGLATEFNDADAEIDPDNVAADGKNGRETLYSDWYVTLGRFSQERRIERDPFAGRPEVPDILYEPTRYVGKGTLWVVLHDNRGGTSWTTVPIEIR